MFIRSTMLRRQCRARCAAHVMLPLLMLVASLPEGQTGSDEQGTVAGNIPPDSLRVGLRGGEDLAPDDYFRYHFETMGIDFDNDLSHADRELFSKKPRDTMRVSILERLFGRRRLDEVDDAAFTDDAATTATSPTYDDLTDENFPSPMPTMGNVGYPMPTARHDGPEDMIWKNQLIDDENMGFKSSSSQAGWYNSKNQISCNRTAYRAWAQKTVASIVMEDGSSFGLTREVINNFWGFASTFWLDEQVPLKRGVAMMKGAQYCRLAMKQLVFDMAGSHGMIKTQFVRDVMCEPMCTESDMLHQMALDVSGCNCDELSTPEESWAFHEEFDFCQRNSARTMCKEFEFCGTWDCPINDFMCPRYEFEGQMFVVRGAKGCRSAATSSKPVSILLSIGCAVLMVLLLKFDAH